MKIIHITASYKPAYVYGGPIQSVAKLCEALTVFSDRRIAAGEDKTAIHQLKVLTTTANGTEELQVNTDTPILIDNVAVSYFKRWTKDHSHFSPQLLLKLRKEILQSQNSNLIIHIHSWWNLVSVLSCLVAKWYKIPVVLSPRGMLTTYTFGNRNSFFKRCIHKVMGNQLLKYCHIHATSNQEKRDVSAIVTPKSIRIVSNLVKLPSKELTIENEISDNKNQKNFFKIIFLSRIEEKKGLELLFEALSLINFPWQLTIGGTGNDDYMRSLKEKAENLKLNDRIIWLGLVSNENKFNLMAEHDLTALTSYNENFANVIVESLGVGTPVLISKFVGLADYVADKNLGWITGLDIEEIKTGIIQAYQDVEKRKKIREIARLLINEDFNDNTLVEQYMEYYQKILAQPSAL
ncbi:XrtY-associated glycosyltransferase XYAG1 [Pedobacter sp. D749]|uniref:XrtY-associated glycosyltransferase XYAG1 n=1 Tax=Pedobacter sp. D749 TaxID=2856523 RepID=UPI001C5A318F|nr:glycosyltransferase [Pedobacter sp. D749]QXU42324.1 glycosyltransferase [Pedobacter sp. D749]